MHKHLSSSESNTFSFERETDYEHSSDIEKKELAGQHFSGQTAIKEMR